MPIFHFFSFIFLSFASEYFVSSISDTYNIYYDDFEKKRTKCLEVSG